MFGCEQVTYWSNLAGVLLRHNVHHVDNFRFEMLTFMTRHIGLPFTLGRHLLLSLRSGIQVNLHSTFQHLFLTTEPPSGPSFGICARARPSARWLHAGIVNCSFQQHAF